MTKGLRRTIRNVYTQLVQLPEEIALQAEMEAGSEAILKSMSPLLIAQAIAALAAGTAFSGVRLDKGSQSLTTGVAADVIWATETYDDGAWFDVGTSDTNIIVPSGITRIHASIRVTFAANATGQRFVSLSKGGVAFAQTRVDAAGAGNTVLTVAGDIDVVASDVITATAFQDSSVSLNITGNSQIGIHALG